MAHESTKRRELRRLYVVDRQPLNAAAKLSDVSYSTARAWKAAAIERGDDWDRARMADDVADGGLRTLTELVLKEFVPLFKSTIESIRGDKLTGVEKAEAMSRLSDAYMKTVKASGAVDLAIAKLGWAMDLLRLLAVFTAERFPQHQAMLLEVLEPFGERVAVEYG